MATKKERLQLRYLEDSTTHNPERLKMKDGLSVCMIVKNEEKNIKEAIESFSPFADEIIINDTGSDKSTHKEIEKTYQSAKTPRITYFRSVWCDNFSQSRNLSINETCYKWIIWLDADDRVPPESAEALNRLKTADTDRCFQLKIKNTVQGLPLGSQWMQMRMFPNRPDIRFEGAIHEQIAKSCIKAGLKEIPVDIEIWHTGYESPEESIKKTKRNLKIMEANHYGKNPTEKCALGAAYYRLENWKMGIEFYLSVYLNPTGVHPQIMFNLPSNIGLGYLRLKEYHQAIDYFDKAHPDNIEAMYQKGQCYEELKDFEKALECYLSVLDMPEMLSVQTQGYHFCRMHAFHLAWRIMVGLKMHKESLNVLNKMHESYPQFRLER